MTGLSERTIDRMVKHGDVRVKHRPYGRPYVFVSARDLRECMGLPA